MAEMETKTSAKHKSGKRQHKKSTRVDLTPMVDLGFLLITFFVFTTTMAKPTAMDIVQPKGTEATTDVAESCALTVLLTKGDKIMYYEGMQQNNPVLKETVFSADGIRALLLQKKAAVKKIKGSADEMVLIVKPSDESSYKNFVDMVDEVQITGVKHYFLADLNEAENKLLKK
jgi:biopolymer transport protein ExbD